MAKILWTGTLGTSSASAKASAIGVDAASKYTTTRASRRRRAYDEPRTVYQRMLDYHALEDSHARFLVLTNRDITPAAITREINAIQSQLITGPTYNPNAVLRGFREQNS
ncbi:hypothetical protein [Arthrobacter sp. JSM 101049]|uniref:hypothetical protein n=1 Tax=Arthrobacter sp. JSM 101049 TaxID=929097 RepID=UPI003563B539